MRLRQNGSARIWKARIKRAIRLPGIRPRFKWRTSGATNIIKSNPISWIKRDYVKNRYLSSRTEYKVGTTTNNNKAKPAWEIQCNTIITMPSLGKSILYLLGLPTTAQSPTQKSCVSPPINQADTILTIRVVSTRKIWRGRYRGIHTRDSSAHSKKFV